MNCFTRKKQWRRVAQRGRGSLAYIEEMEKIRDERSRIDLNSNMNSIGNSKEKLTNYYIKHLYSSTNYDITPKKVTFDINIRVILIPTRHEYNQVGLGEELWWTGADYSAFRYSSLCDEEYDKELKMNDDCSGHNFAQENMTNETKGEIKNIVDDENMSPEKQPNDATETILGRSRLLAKEAHRRKKVLRKVFQRQVTKMFYGHSTVHASEHKTTNFQLQTCNVSAGKLMGDPLLLSALPTSSAAFFITSSFLPDSPIVFTSQGLLHSTGYELKDVIGKTFSFLQGPGTDQLALHSLRRGVLSGVDTTVVLLHYRADGTSFYNQVFAAPLRDKNRKITNFIWVLTEVEVRSDISVSVVSKSKPKVLSCVDVHNHFELLVMGTGRVTRNATCKCTSLAAEGATFVY